MLWALSGTTRFLRRGEAHCRSLGYARDDKGRTATDLYFRESDGTEELPIRLSESSVSNHSPLVIPSVAEGSAVCLAPTQKNTGGSVVVAVSFSAWSLDPCKLPST